MSATALILAYTGLAIVSTAIVWKGSGWLESSSEKLSTHYQVPPLIQVSVVLAVGSSFPELSMAAISAALYGEFELGVAAVIRSALFNILMIPALAELCGEERLTSTRDLLHKETQFCLVAIAVLLLVFSFAAIYNSITNTSGARLGEMTRGLSLLSLGLYAAHVYLQYQDTVDHTSDGVPDDINLSKQGASSSTRWQSSWSGRRASFGRPSGSARCSTPPVFVGHHCRGGGHLRSGRLREHSCVSVWKCGDQYR